MGVILGTCLFETTHFPYWIRLRNAVKNLDLQQLWSLSYLRSYQQFATLYVDPTYAYIHPYGRGQRGARGFFSSAPMGGDVPCTACMSMYVQTRHPAHTRNTVGTCWGESAMINTSSIGLLSSVQSKAATGLGCGCSPAVQTVEVVLVAPTCSAESGAVEKRQQINDYCMPYATHLSLVHRSRLLLRSAATPTPTATCCCCRR